MSALAHVKYPLYIGDAYKHVLILQGSVNVSLACDLTRNVPSVIVARSK